MVTTIALTALTLILVVMLLHELGRRYPKLWCIIHTHDGLAIQRLRFRRYKVICWRCGGLFLAEKTLLGWSYESWTDIEESWFRTREDMVTDEHESYTHHS